MNSKIYYVGQHHEVYHHAAPLLDRANEFGLTIEIADCELVQHAAKPGDIAIFFSEHFDRFRSLIMTLKQRDVGTLYAIDGILEWRNAWENRKDEPACPWTMRPCLSHLVASIGSRQTAVLKTWGNQGRVVTIGLPRLDQLQSQSRRDRTSAPSSAQGVDPFRILIMTAKCPGFTDQQIETTANSLQALHSFFCDRVEQKKTERPIELIWRLTGGLEDRVPIALGEIDPNTEPLQQVLSQVDAVITTSSTAILEAMLSRLPVALLDFHNTPIYQDCVLRISEEKQIEAVVSRMLGWDQQPAWQRHQDFLLYEGLAADGNATLRMLTLLQTMKRTMDDQIRQGRPISLSAEDFQSELPIGQLGITTEAVDWLTHPESSMHKCGDPEVVLAYAAELERKYRHLEEKFEEAKIVFEGMQNHPILGRLLRTHKWLSDTFSKRIPEGSKRVPDEVSQSSANSDDPAPLRPSGNRSQPLERSLTKTTPPQNSESGVQL